MALDDTLPRDLFYNAYLQTYLQRDVRDLTRVGDERAFLLFLRAAAARTGQLLNYADLARDVDIDQKTAKAWLSILETSGIVYLTKRLLTPQAVFPRHGFVRLPHPMVIAGNAGSRCYVRRNPRKLATGGNSQKLVAQRTNASGVFLP